MTSVVSFADVSREERLSDLRRYLVRELCNFTLALPTLDRLAWRQSQYALDERFERC
jgi:hypothetical protein